ncbi:MAG TPA: hypothetical protein VGX00_04220 [Thermoplasmata archaeon]|nr:hypothetical protein [Thermoplasmata archaeon]
MIRPSDDPRPWVSVSDLSEYAFCPRARWYRHHPPPEGRAAASVRSAVRGQEYHRRALAGVRQADEGGSTFALLALAGAALLVVALLVAGVL